MALNVQTKSYHIGSFKRPRADRGHTPDDIGMVLVEPTSQTTLAGKYQRWEMFSENGNGWAENIQISHGLKVGLGEYLLDNRLEVNCPALDCEVALGFGVLHSGTFDLHFPDSKRSEQFSGCWVRQGEADGFSFSQPAGKVARGVKLELPHSMVEAWLGETSSSLSGSLEKKISGQAGSRVGGEQSGSPFKSFVCGSSGIDDIVTRMFATPRDNVCGLLKFEALTLDLLSRLLSSNCAAREQEARYPGCRGAIDDAVDILRQELTSPPTIAALARRVGINECYLKKQFRERTGRSIGEFVRELRMGLALELLESGNSNVLQAALSVGYSNPSHFSVAFKAFHGHLPSSCLVER